MISMKARYAVQALVYMASHVDQEETFVARKIAQAEDIPQKFLEEVLLDLRKDGLLASKAGKSGGYRFKVRAESITLQHVFQAISDPLALNPTATATNTSLRRLFVADDIDSLLQPIESALYKARHAVLSDVTIASLAATRLARSQEALVHDFQI